MKKSLARTATAAVLLVSPALASAQELLDANFIGDGVVELLLAHGFDTAARGEAVLQDDMFIIRDLSAAKGDLNLQVGALEIHRLGDEEGSRMWLKIENLHARDITADFSTTTTLRMKALSASDLRFLNLNEADKESEYENIDGAFSAVRFDHLSAEDVELETTGRLILGDMSLSAEGFDWWETPSFPSVGKLEISGNIAPEVLGLQADGQAIPFAISAGSSIDTVYKIASLDLRADFSHAGELVGRLNLDGMDDKAARDTIAWMLGSQETPAQEAEVTRLALAARGTTWLEGALSPLQKALPDWLTPAFNNGLSLLTTSQTEVLVLEPPVPVRLIEMVSGDEKKTHDWGRATDGR